MNRKRQPDIDPQPGEQAPPAAPASGEMVRVGKEDDPLVRALVDGGERDSAPANEQPRELSPESLALLLDRLDGIAEDNDATPTARLHSPWNVAGPGRSGVLPRARIKRLRLRGSLAIAAVMLAAAIALLWPSAGPRPRGHVVGHTADDGVRTVDLPAAPEQRAEPAATGAQPQDSKPTEEATPVKRRPGRLRVRTDGPAEVRLDGRVVGRVPGTLQLPAGQHDLLFRTAGGVSFYRTVRVRAGQTVELQVP